jgi:hypothetical protein
MNGRWNRNALVAVAGLVLVIAGCSQSPLKPGDSALNGVTSGSSAPPIVRFADDGTVDYATAPVGADAEQPVDMTAPGCPALKSSMLVDGARGGSLRVGRFYLTVPAGAIEGTATVTVTMPDSTVMICDLSISPDTANHFKVPVELTADLSGADASTSTMYWYDPAGQRWVNLFVKSRIVGTKVTTSLEHFSTYGAGKAGW